MSATGHPPRRLLTALAAAAIAAVIALVPGRSGPGGPSSRADAGMPQAAQRPPGEDAAIDGVLGDVPFVATGGARRREIALTFDDGPGPSTPALLRYLTAHAVPATFFLVGRSIARRADVVRREIDAGFTLATHTESHGRLASRPPAEQRREILATAERISRLSGRAVRLFRPPFGSFDARTLAILRAERMLMVLWSINPRDFLSSTSTRQVVRATLKAARPGAIVLLHDGPGPRPRTVAAVRTLVPALRRRGYRLVSLPQLLRDNPPPRRQRAPGGVRG